MPSGVWIVFAIFMVCIIIVPIILSVVFLNQGRRGYKCEYQGHKIVVKYGATYAKLIIDGKLRDEVKSYQMHTANLNSKIDDVEVKVRMGSGFVRPIIKLFINEELYEMVPVKKEEEESVN